MGDEHAKRFDVKKQTWASIKKEKLWNSFLV